MKWVKRGSKYLLKKYKKIYILKTPIGYNLILEDRDYSFPTPEIRKHILMEGYTIANFKDLETAKKYAELYLKRKHY